MRSSRNTLIGLYSSFSSIANQKTRSRRNLPAALGAAGRRYGGKNMKQAATGRQRARKRRSAAPPHIKAPLIAAKNSLTARPGALSAARLPGPMLYEAAPPRCADTAQTATKRHGLPQQTIGAFCSPARQPILSRAARPA